MSSLPVLKARGLHLSSNQTSAVPEGAMSQADNLVIPFRDVVQSRRGQAPGPAGFGSSGDRGNVLEVFNDELVSQLDRKSVV